MNAQLDSHSADDRNLRVHVPGHRDWRFVDAAVLVILHDTDNHHGVASIFASNGMAQRILVGKEAPCEFLIDDAYVGRACGVGIDEVAAEVLPADKAAAVRNFQAGGKKVAMVGDGVNDAPALATADVGIAIGAGTDVAIESAGIVLVRSDPRDVVGAIELSRATYRKMIQNLVWATAYNLVAIPAAGGLFIRWGVELPMSVGAVAMNSSTIIVAVNAQLLRRLRLQGATL